jgi:hypothetical protein
MLDDRIVDWLTAHSGRPQSVAELAAAIPEATPTNTVRTCILPRTQDIIGRYGASTIESPYRFYVKRTKNSCFDGGRVTPSRRRPAKST